MGQRCHLGEYCGFLHFSAYRCVQSQVGLFLISCFWRGCGFRAAIGRLQNWNPPLVPANREPDANMKYIRYTLAALCLAAIVGLLALWLRSYWRTDMWQDQVGRSAVTVVSVRGKLPLRIQYNLTLPIKTPSFRSWANGTLDFSEMPRSGFKLTLMPDQVAIIVPHWFLMLPFAAITYVTSNRPWRFRLRTILAGMAILAALFAITAISN